MNDLEFENKSIFSIGRSLGRICRWAGNGPIYFSVFQHSIVVALLLPPALRLAGLLHDASESWTADWVSLYKREDFRVQERDIAARLYGDLGLTLPTVEEHLLIKEADHKALHAEVWAGCAIEALKERYPERDAEAERMTREAIYNFPADQLVLTDIAGVEFERLFDEYKNYDSDGLLEVDLWAV